MTANPLTAFHDAERTTDQSLPEELIETYQRDGFVRVPGVISQAEADQYRQAAMDCLTRKQEALESAGRTRRVFSQAVNVWREDPAMRPLTFHPNLARIAQRLARTPLRLWHDHILTKMPQNQARTEFHQDQLYWPHENSFQPISCWLALQDTPAEMGCMSFIPGSHCVTGLQAQNLSDAESLYTACPEMRWWPRVTLPLRAGDCTFHHGLCAHQAGTNETDTARVAHVIIYVDEATRYTGKRHVVTDSLDLQPGEPLAGEVFPPVASFADGS